ncbi:flavin binding monooxygenase [Sporothrix brasiliensis 5110]|uniref:Flavin binding monooxygenase n=1 Tax=Sporothrix brasiliensis 5110 TaxID=1398154 RepID=A0A0C2JD21_9PEZI|nr:flavin binding monooxygenase [Sporothrix brasiliensis 5110]KIH94832.1 flavin binding monooxygenase [Sporothrix brasiliensis 5110]
MGSASVEELDVIIVGAGLSGLNSAYLLKKQIPDAKFAILEGRNIIGGTWAFWKYPGARSDSSATVFRFAWHPWPHDLNFPDAPLVQAYAEDAAKVHGLDKHIRFNNKVGDRRWSTAEQMWTVDVTDAETGAQLPPIRARWLVNCSGYYSYEEAQKVEIPGIKQFRGEVVHPQFWSSDIDMKGKNVVIIGSGATAITMLPHVSKVAKHTTMLQRSPSYVMALPRKDKMTHLLQRLLPRRLADWIDWYRQMFLESVFVWWLQTFPGAGRCLLRALTKRRLPSDLDVDVHFKPAYNPFEQRLCLCPDADFFKALQNDPCTIVTDHIDTVTPTGIRLKGSGDEIPADMIITATGLYVQLMNGRIPLVDGKPIRVTDLYGWRSCMIEGAPNLCFIIGYTTGTWTPGADAHFRTVLSVMKEMRKRGATSATPTIDPAVRKTMPKLPAVPVTSGYLVNARDRLPMSSGRYPWSTGLTYAADAWHNLTGNAHDGMVYTVPNKKRL